MSDVFRRAVDQVSRPIASKNDFIEHFRQQYGEKEWKRQATIYIAGTSNAKSKEYKSAARNFQARNTQAGRGAQSDKATAKWKGLGQGLPRIMTKKEFTLTIQAKQHDSRGGGKTRDRTIKVEFAGQAAKDFVNHPTWPKVWHQYGFSFPVAESDAEDWGEDDIDFDYNEYDVDIDYELSDASVSAA